LIDGELSIIKNNILVVDALNRPTNICMKQHARGLSPQQLTVTRPQLLSNTVKMIATTNYHSLTAK